MTEYPSGTKPRYDDGGSEFGNIHRELPKSCGMFDIDRMTATATVSLEITKQDVAFIEYKTMWNDEKNVIVFKAMFEIKHHGTESVYKALQLSKGTATWAQAEMAKKLGARYFIVVANYGNPPFKFYELSKDEKMDYVGELDYAIEDKKEKVEEFWKEIGLL